MKQNINLKSRLYRRFQGRSQLKVSQVFVLLPLESNFNQKEQPPIEQSPEILKQKSLIPTVVRKAHEGLSMGNKANIPLKLFAINSKHHFYPNGQHPSNLKHPQYRAMRNIKEEGVPKMSLSKRIQILDKPKIISDPKKRQKGFNTQDKTLSQSQQKKDKIKKRNIKKEKKRSQKKEQKITPFDFIQLVKSDPEMADEFCYLQRCGQPYDFKVVEFDSGKKEEYMTISARGITHFVEGEGNFLTLDEWEREYTLYKQLRQIEFFSKYKIWKNFLLWKRLMRREKMREYQMNLKKDLFMLDLHLRKPLLAIRDACLQPQKWNLLEIKQIKDPPLHKEQFLDRQKEQRFKTVESMVTLENVIKAKLVESCEQSLQFFKEDNRISSKTDELNEDEEPAPLLVGDESNKDMPYTQEATIRTHYKKLKKFIKLIDYFLIDVKLSLISQSTAKVLKKIQEHNNDLELIKQKKRHKHFPILIVKSSFITGSTDVNYDPSRQETKEIFQTSFRKAIDLICQKNKQLIQDPDFSLYVKIGDYEDETEERSIRLKTLVQENLVYKQNSSMIYKELDVAMDGVEEEGQKMIPLLQIYQKNQLLNIEEFENYEAENFKSAIQQFQSEDEQFKDLKGESEIGMFKFEKAGMIKNIKNCSADRLKQIRELMPRLLMQRADSFCEMMDGILKEIMPFGQNKVDVFVVFKRRVEELNTTIDNYKPMMEFIQNLKIIIDEQKIKLSSMAKQKVIDAGALLSKLRKRIEDANNGLDSQKTENKRNIEKEIPFLNSQVMELEDQTDNPCFGDEKEDITFINDKLNTIREGFEKISKRTKELQGFQVELEMDVTAFQKLDEFNGKLKIMEKLWQNKMKWKENYEKWLNLKVFAVNVEEMNDEMQKIFKAANLCQKSLLANPAAKEFKKTIDDFLKVNIVVSALNVSAMDASHWIEVQKLYQNFTGKKGHWINKDPKNNKLTVARLITAKMGEINEDIVEISSKATKEKMLLKQLNDIRTFIDTTKLEFKSRERDEEESFFVLDKNEEFITILDDNMVQVTNILANRYVTKVKGKAKTIQKNLKTISDVFDEWINCQKLWLHLEPIFQAPDIKQNKSLQKEVADFKKKSEEWKRAMDQCQIDGCTARSVADQKFFSLKVLRENTRLFEGIEKQLQAFIKKKRGIFQRFYFFSDQEMIEVLMYASKPKLIAPYLKKCFEAADDLIFINEETNILSIKCADGETLDLGIGGSGLPISNANIEVWLKNLEQEMKNQIQKRIYKFYNDTTKFQENNEKRADWILKPINQASIVVDSILWTSITANYLSFDEEEDGDDNEEEQGLMEWYKTNNQEILELIIKIQGELTKIQRKTIITLLINDVHYKDIIEDLYKKGCNSVTDFEWVKQLRFYMIKDECVVRQVQASINYGKEYLGVSSRLVITPLTDRCWLTITGALHIHLGAAPQGPAGTGKTESTKDLAKALGIYCVVFNCSDQVTVKMMQKLFLGLSANGAWTCLDEFNRIEIEVLSVIAQQVKELQNKVAMCETSEIGKDLRIKMGDVGDIIMKKENIQMQIAITMNPGYAGRTELPDNLKVLFRPVAMMIPNYTLIAQIMLFAEGFSGANDLSRKMTKLYKLASEQLSCPRHYDFGMRAVKSVLNMAGRLKRQNPEKSEDSLLIQAMIDSNVPKFLSQDIPLFDAIITDLFPLQESMAFKNVDLDKVIEENIIKKKLQPDIAFIEKVNQLDQTFAVRFGVMLIGPTMGGKTQLYEILRDSYTLLRERGHKNEKYQKIHTVPMNPKSITMAELYGEMDKDTGEWTNGLAADVFDKFVKNEDENGRKYEDVNNWIIFDGPVDALWIENLNTVLDDNMTLCLSNGQRMKLNWTMRCLFEAQDLNEASPATVSRCGIIYLDAKVINSTSLFRSLLDQELPDLLNQEQMDILYKTYESSFVDLQIYSRKYFKEAIQTVDHCLTTAIIKMIKMILINDPGKSVIDNLHEEKLEQTMNQLFVYAYSWGCGAQLQPEFTDKFESQISNKFDISLFPRMGSIFNVCFRFTKDGSELYPWDEITPTFSYKSTQTFFQLFVPTKDTVKYEWMLDNCIKIENPLFLTGETGTGKTMIVNNTLDKMTQRQDIMPQCMTFSANASSYNIQMAVEQKQGLITQRKSGKFILMPPGKMKLVIYVDDVNMPTKEEYGAQPPIEMLRLIQVMKGFYDRKLLFWKNLARTVIILSAAPGGGRSVITQRFSNKFHIMCMPPSNQESLTKIFLSILNQFLVVNKFKKDICMMSESLVKGTLQLYQEIAKNLRPTPTKSHYTFNLRDTAKVFQGLLRASPMIFSKTDPFVQLWVHEMTRVFSDRLVNDKDKSWFQEKICAIIQIELRRQWEVKDLFGSDPLFCANFLKPGLDQEDRKYEIVQDLNKLQKIVKDYMEEECPGLNLILFRVALEHLCRIARVFSQQRGSILLVGLGGSGKKSLTTLASALAGCKKVMISPHSQYRQKDFKADLIEMMKTAGIYATPVCFLFPDNHVMEESFLEDINNLLNTGEVPDLFEKKDDLDDLKREMGEQIIKLKLDISDSWKFFVERLRTNLHLCLAFSPVGELLRIRMRLFPSLVNCCTIDWLNPWPDEALLAVSKIFLGDIDFDGASKKVMDSLFQICVSTHLSVIEAATQFETELKRKVYITPKSYIDLLSSYGGLLTEKYTDISTDKNKLTLGVVKLQETEQIVSSLQVQLKEKQPELEQKNKDTQKLYKEFHAKKSKADTQKEEVQGEKAIVDAEKQDIQEKLDEANAKMKQVEPQLKEAKAALNTLDSSILAEIKQVKKNPPPFTQCVLYCVSIIVIGKVPKDWQYVLKEVMNMKMKSNMQAMSPEKLSEKSYKALKKQLVKYKVFRQDIEKTQKNSAIRIIASWVWSLFNTYDVCKEVAQKRKICAKLMKNLQGKIQAVNEMQTKLDEVIGVVNDLKNKMDITKKKKKELEDDIRQTKDRLERAGKLNVGLADEKIRWAESIVRLTDAVNKVTGDVFIAAASVSYYGPFTGNFRKSLVDKWLLECQRLDIPCSEKYNLQTVLGNVVKIREWRSKGLPSDDVSVNNGILVEKGKSYPLMIDPQLQANKWIKGMEKRNDLVVTKMDKLERELKMYVPMGQPILIEDIGEELDPILENLLTKNVQKLGQELKIKIGDQLVDFDPRFNLYLTTKLANPHYLPEIFIKVTMINFTVTRFGLIEQLLAEVVSKEKPEIEIQKSELVTSISSAKDQLAKIQATILDLLVNSKGNILDDQKLVDSLENSKKSSLIINTKLEEAEITEVEINAARGQYQTVAVRGAILYFVVADLANIASMYQFSLTYFQKLFQQVLMDSKESEVIEERIAILIKQATETIYLSVCRGLFNDHKRIFSFLICSQIEKNNGNINTIEWNKFLKGIAFANLEKIPPKPEELKVSEQSWQELYLMGECRDDIKTIYDHAVKNTKEWNTWISQEIPSEHKLPGEYDEICTNFQKLMLVKILREEKTLYAINSYIENTLGTLFISAVKSPMDEIYAGTDYKTPFVFVLSTGADPSQTIEKFSKEKGKQNLTISLGQGQGKIAIKMIDSSLKDGNWVTLQNCHLSKSFMPELEKKLYQLSESLDEEYNTEFRLFLTSMPCDYFPIFILQNSAKVTNEPPKGLKANVQKTFDDLTQEDLELCAEKPELYRKLIFNLSFFHAVVQERRKFGPLGWNILYEFKESDLQTSIKQLLILLDQDEDVPWEALFFLTGQINYGGRVTDDTDRRCLLAILDKYMKEEITKEKYIFSPSGVYYTPADCKIEGYRKYISELPLNDLPEVYGMHENANIAFNLKESNLALKTVLDIQPRESGGEAGQTPDSICLELIKIIQAQCPDLILIDKTEEELQEFYKLNSLNICLIQELQRFNILLKKMQMSLGSLKRAINGEEVMSEELDQMFSCFLNNQIPANWEKVGYLSLKTLSKYMEDFVLRVEFFSSWFVKACNEEAPDGYWISAFFLPAGFLTAISQNYARKNLKAIDELDFSYTLQKDSNMSSFTGGIENGAYIYGLFIEGCRFDFSKLKLVDSEPGVMFTKAPVILFMPTPDYVNNPEEYKMPLYKTVERWGILSTTGQSTNFVCYVNCKSDHPPEYWVLKGAAMFCALRD